jgi:phosphopantothenoylcysteine decarboxylase/phosphopantothenate--cysteine ligase
VIALAARCPLLIAPAMDVAMFEHPANQANLETLRQRGAGILGPAEGRMASGLVGKGRLVEPAELVGHIRLALARDGQLAGTKVVISAGATQEPIDPVRVITNRSSGKQGFALAQAALDRGAEVTLIAGQTSLPTPVGAHRINVRTAAEMQAAVLDAATQADVLLMAAAVADFKPEEVAAEKIKRKKGTRTISLEPTSDILSVVSEARKEHGRPKLTVGFAAESGDLIANARTKIESKGLALIVANDITELDAGFEVDTNRVTLVDAEGGVQELPLMTKTEVSEALIERVIYLLEELGTPLAK